MHWDYENDFGERLASGIRDADTPSVDQQVIAAYGNRSKSIERSQVADGPNDPDFFERTVIIYFDGALAAVSSLDAASAQTSGMPVSSIGPVTIANTGTRQSVAEGSLSAPAVSPETAVLGIGATGVLLAAAAGLGFLWFLVHEVEK